METLDDMNARWKTQCLEARVTPAQAKVALYNAGLLDEVDAAIASAYRPIQIYWESASVFELNHPYVQGIGALLGLSDAAMADLFTAAALL